jgi:hypothetical protein
MIRILIDGKVVYFAAELGRRIKQECDKKRGKRTS